MAHFGEFTDQHMEIPLFQGVAPASLERLFAAGGVRIADYTKEQMLYLEGEECTTLDVILRGSISIQSFDEVGNIYKPKVLEAGEVLGATLLFGKYNQYPMSVVVDSAARILHIKKSEVLLLCKEEKVFLSSLLKIISDKTYELSLVVNRLSSKSLRSSLLSYLHSLVKRQGSSTIVLPLSKKELANRLGFSRTSLSRELTALAKEGLLSYTGRTIHLHISPKS